MRSQAPDYSLAMAILLMWGAIGLTAIVAYQVFQWWRRRHPPPKPKLQRAYASTLRQRLDARRAGKRRAKSKAERTGPPLRP